MTFEKTIQELKAQGLIIEDEVLMISFLKHVGLDRMEEYFHRYRDRGTLLFFPETTFSRIVDIYIFDRRLRGLIIDAIDRIEISFKANASFVIQEFSGDNIWQREVLTSLGVWEDFWNKNKDRWLKNKRCKSFAKSADLEIIPSEILICITSLGELLSLFDNLKTPVKKAIIERMGIPSLTKFNSWMNGIRHLRNKAAHHERIWNENLTINLAAPEPNVFLQQNNSIGAYLKIINILMNEISPSSSWKDRLRKLINKFHIPVDKMDLEGFFDEKKDVIN